MIFVNLAFRYTPRSHLEEILKLIPSELWSYRMKSKMKVKPFTTSK